jgi:hypothetical protein
MQVIFLVSNKEGVESRRRIDGFDSQCSEDSIDSQCSFWKPEFSRGDAGDVDVDADITISFAWSLIYSS